MRILESNEFIPPADGLGVFFEKTVRKPFFANVQLSLKELRQLDEIFIRCELADDEYEYYTFYEAKLRNDGAPIFILWASPVPVLYGIRLSAKTEAGKPKRILFSVFST